MNKRTPLAVEALETRTTPAVFNTPWPDATRLTLSFAADGTSVGGAPSNLFQTLGANAATAAWQTAILRAFQTWAVNANVNVGLVADGGQAFGVSGPIKGDRRFGDLRIAATPLSTDVLAVAQPFDVTAGSWSGDLRFNSQYSFGPGAPYDLFAVALHEAGHALGIGPSTDPKSAMYQIFQGARGGLTSADIAALQALYGGRAPDANDAAAPNDSLASATRVKVGDSSSNSQIAGVAMGDLTTTRDLDYYRFSIEGTTGTRNVAVRLVTSGISPLVARLSVYDASNRLVATTAATDPLKGNLWLRVPNVPALTNYQIKVESATADVFGIGSYRLEIQPDGFTMPAKPRFSNDDAGSNDDPLTATDLRKNSFRADPRYDYFAEASLSATTDVDYYRLRVPQGPARTPVAMTVMAWGQDATPLDPRVSVLDKNFQPVAAEVLVNENGNYTIQVPNAIPNNDYYLVVRSATAGTVGNYGFGIDFAAQASPATTYSTGILTAAAPQALRTLTVNQSTLFHFVASASDGVAGVNPNVALRLTAYDANNRVVFSQFVGDDQPVTVTVFLAPGKYTFRFAAATRDGRPLPNFAFTLKGQGLSDPIGPQQSDPTGGAFAPPTQPPPSGPSFSWLPYGSYTFGGTTDPYGTPWWF